MCAGAELKERRGEYKCGRYPWLQDCEGGEAVERLGRCCSMTGCADPLGLKRVGMADHISRYRCLSAHNSTFTRGLHATVSARLEGTTAEPEVEPEVERGAA